MERAAALTVVDQLQQHAWVWQRWQGEGRRGAWQHSMLRHVRCVRLPMSGRSPRQSRWPRAGSRCLQSPAWVAAQQQGRLGAHTRTKQHTQPHSSPAAGMPPCPWAGRACLGGLPRQAAMHAPLARQGTGEQPGDALELAVCRAAHMGMGIWDAAGSGSGGPAPTVAHHAILLAGCTMLCCQLGLTQESDFLGAAANVARRDVGAPADVAVQLRLCGRGEADNFSDCKQS